MCELTAVIMEDNHKKTLMEDVVRLVVDNNEINLTGMLGDTMTVRGRILHVDLTKQEALIQKIK